MNGSKFPYEQGAYRREVEGWTCSGCGHFWGDNERSARYCCASSMACECGGRRDKFYTRCDACRAVDNANRFLALEIGEWDGRQMVYDDASNRYFSTPEDLIDYYECEGLDLAGARPVLCTPNNGPTFCMSEFLGDSLPEDQELDADTREIDDLVNKWIAEHAPYSWYPGKKRLLIDQYVGDPAEGGPRGETE